MHIHHYLNTDGELRYHKWTVSEVLFTITPSDSVCLIFNWPFPALPTAGLEAVQDQKHRSSSLVHNNTAANKEEQRSSCRDPNSWGFEKHRLTTAAPHGLQCHCTNTVQELCKAAISIHPPGSRNCALTDNACSLLLSYMWTLSCWLKWQTFLEHLPTSDTYTCLKF